MSDVVELKDKGLKALIKAFNAKLPEARIGVMGSKDSRKDGNTNALIGAVHEYGSPSRKIPARSFLRVPITEHLNAYLVNSGAFDKDTLARVIKEGTIRAWMEKVAITGNQIVQEAFTTGGFGQWKAWKNPHYKNNTGQVLIDTQQLRNSIFYEVE